MGNTITKAELAHIQKPLFSRIKLPKQPSRDLIERIYTNNHLLSNKEKRMDYVENIWKKLGCNTSLFTLPYDYKKAPARFWETAIAKDVQSNNSYMEKLAHGSLAVVFGERSDGLCAIRCYNDQMLEEMLLLNPKFKNTFITYSGMDDVFQQGLIFVKMTGEYPVFCEMHRGTWLSTHAYNLISGVEDTVIAVYTLNDCSVISMDFLDIAWPADLRCFWAFRFGQRGIKIGV